MASVMEISTVGRRLIFACSLLVLSACHTTPPPSASGPPRSIEELQATLRTLVEQPRFAGALWGIKVASLDTGRTWVEHQASLRLSPASNSKLYSSALALDQWGGAFRITTPILATGPVDEAGILKGDVIIAGRGDPSWNTRTSKKDFWTVFEPFISVLQKAKVRQITGDLIADATYFRAKPQGAGWSVTDLSEYYGAEVSAVTLEDNYADMRISPAKEVGKPCVVEWLHPRTGLVIDNRTTTLAANGPRQIHIIRLPGENTVRVFGELPLGGKEELTETTVERPAGWFASALKEALAQRGIQVAGAARDLRWPEATAVTPQAITLGEVSSPPLSELVTTLLKSSQNLHTDLVFTHLGETHRTPATPAWVTSDELAVTALKEFLQKNALRADEVIFEEGSGLSRNNLTTAAATVRLLQFMSTHGEAAAFTAALPVAGVDGTLRSRMKETAAAGNVRAKTGTLRWANSLSGFVTTASGERLVFSLMLNRYSPPGDRTPRQELDEIAVLLASYRGPNESVAPKL